MGEKIIVSVGMGPGQYEFIKRLSETGYSVAAFGKGKNSNEAIELCKYHNLIDTCDYENAIKWLNSLRGDIIALGSYSGGIAVHTLKILSNYYNVPTSIPNDVIFGVDKVGQQELYEKFKLSSIKTWKVSDFTALAAQSGSDEEYILKPVLGRGSKGIRKFSRGELIKYIKEKDLNDNSNIIQTVSKGTEYRCIVIVQNSDLKLLAPIMRMSYRDTFLLGTLCYSERHLSVIEGLIDGFIKNSGIVNTILKIDIIVSESSIDVIEMDIGVGGGSYYKKFISRLYDRDLMDEYIKLITNRPIDPFEISNPDLRMDYIFNHKPYPVKYDINQCLQMISTNFGTCEIQTNLLHPEDKGGFKSNADFIFAIIHQNKNLNRAFLLDDFVNEWLLYEK